MCGGTACSLLSTGLRGRRAGKQTLAILEKKTNKVYILAAERPGEDPNKSVLDYAGMPVLVKGKVFTRGGIMAIQVASIVTYSAAKAAAH